MRKTLLSWQKRETKIVGSMRMKHIFVRLRFFVLKLINLLMFSNIYNKNGNIHSGFVSNFI